MSIGKALINLLCSVLQFFYRKLPIYYFIVNTNECIYVALDFEGLKSLERTPQEGIFTILL